jgi:hypothetical protein
MKLVRMVLLVVLLLQGQQWCFRRRRTAVHGRVPAHGAGFPGGPGARPGRAERLCARVPRGIFGPALGFRGRFRGGGKGAAVCIRDIGGIGGGKAIRSCVGRTISFRTRVVTVSGKARPRAPMGHPEAGDSSARLAWLWDGHGRGTIQAEHGRPVNECGRLGPGFAAGLGAGPGRASARRCGRGPRGLRPPGPLPASRGVPCRAESLSRSRGIRNPAPADDHGPVVVATAGFP